MVGKLISLLCESVYRVGRSAFIQGKQGRVYQQFKQLGAGANLEFPWNCLTGLNCFEIGVNFYANKHVYLGAYPHYHGVSFSPRVVIGDNVHLNFGCQITCIDAITIGDGVLVGSHVLITDHSHGNLAALKRSPPPKERLLAKTGAISIGKNVLIGSGAAILGGVTLGDSCVVGANAVVTKSFGPGSVVAGAPAKQIR